MRLTIFKYRQIPYLYSNTPFNYFNDKTEFVDKIQINRFLQDNMPTFTEEYNDEDNVNILKAGYYTLTLSLIEGSKSLTGKDIYEFIYENQLYKYLAIIELESGRTFTGIVDYKSIEINETVSDNTYYARFNVIGIEKEAIDFISLQGITYLNHDLPLEQYINEHIQSCLNNKLSSLCDIDFRQEYGTYIAVSQVIHNRMIELNNGSMPVWEVYKGFLNLLGIRIKIELDNINDIYYPKFKIVLYSPQSGTGIINNIKEKTITKGKRYSTKPYVFISCGKSAHKVNPFGHGDDTYLYYGILLEDANTFYIADIANLDRHNNFQLNEDIKDFLFYIQYNTPHYYYDDILIFEPGLYSSIYQDPQFGCDIHIPFGRCLYDAMDSGNFYSNKLLLEKVTRINYLSYMDSIADTLKMKIPFSEQSMLKVGSVIEKENKNFICDRITSIDLKTEEAETEWTEV